MHFAHLFLLFLVANLQRADSGIIQSTFHRLFIDRIINIGSTKLLENIPILTCGFLCAKAVTCVGYHYETDSSKALNLCKLQLATEYDFPKAFFYQPKSNYYALVDNNPLHYKNASECDPIDPSLELSYFCNRNPNEKQTSLFCRLNYANLSIGYDIQTKLKIKSSLAQDSCTSQNMNSNLVLITEKRVQDWFCNILTVFCGQASSMPFTIGLYQDSQSGTWRYGSANHDRGLAPENFYQNWYNETNKTIQGVNKLCVQMLSSDPYNFKWILASCNAQEGAYTICEE